MSSQKEWSKKEKEERLKENLCGKGKIVCVVKMVKVLVSVSVSVSASELQVAFCVCFSGFSTYTRASFISHGAD